MTAETTLSKFRKYLWISQTTLFVSLLICSLIMPHVVSEEGGVSNFGNHPSTVALYSLGFLTNSVFLWKAATLVKQSSERLKFIEISLKLLGVFVLIIFVSTFPRKLSFTYSAIHDYVGASLYGYQLVVALWIVKKRHTVVSVFLLAVQTLGALIALLSVLDIIRFLYIGQAIGSIGFGLLLCLILPDAVRQSSRPPRS